MGNKALEQIESLNDSADKFIKYLGIKEEEVNIDKLNASIDLYNQLPDLLAKLKELEQASQVKASNQLSNVNQYPQQETHIDIVEEPETYASTDELELNIELIEADNKNLENRVKEIKNNVEGFSESLDINKIRELEERLRLVKAEGVKINKLYRIFLKKSIDLGLY